MKRIFIAAVCLAALAFVQTSCNKEAKILGKIKENGRCGKKNPALVFFRVNFNLEIRP